MTKTVTIFEDWVEVGGAIWYKWKLEGEKEWHFKRTAYKEKPVIYMKVLPIKEYEMFFKDMDEDKPL